MLVQARELHTASHIPPSGKHRSKTTISTNTTKGTQYDRSTEFVFAKPQMEVILQLVLPDHQVYSSIWFRGWNILP